MQYFPADLLKSSELGLSSAWFQKGAFDRWGSELGWGGNETETGSESELELDPGQEGTTHMGTTHMGGDSHRCRSFIIQWVIE